MRKSRLVSILAIVTASGAAAEPPAATREVLDHVRRAVGYDRIAGTGGLSATGTCRLAGMEMEYSLLFAGDRQSVQRLDGPIDMVMAMDGESVWIGDMGGEVRPLHGSERDGAEMVLTTLTYGYLGAGEPLIFGEASPAGADGLIAVPFTDRDGIIAGALSIDSKTWLPAKWAYNVGAESSTVTMTGTVTHGGVTMPARVTNSSTTGSKSDVVIQELKKAPVFIRSPYEMPPHGAHDVAFDAGAGPDLEIVRAPTGHLLVHPLINGKDVGWFIFDTGAGQSVLTTALISELGVESFGEVPASGIGGVTTAVFCRPETLTIGPMTITRPLMIGLDLSFLDVHMGRRIAGLIGYNVLARSVTRLDMKTPAISLYDPASFNDPALMWQRLVVDERVPHVDASFEGKTGLFKLDSGAGDSTVSFHAPATQKFKLLEGRKTKASQAGGVGGMIPIQSGTLAWFEVAGHRSTEVEAGFATEPKGAFADPYSDGTIGGGLIEPFVMVLDYVNERIAFVRRQ